MSLGRDDQNMESRNVDHPLRQRFGDLDRARELVLDVNETAGDIDGGKEQPRDFIGAAAGGGFQLGPCDAGRYPHGFCLGRLRPAAALDRLADLRMTTGGRPSRGRDLAERRRSLALDHALNIVKWRIGFAVRVSPQRMLGKMLIGVPAPDGQVEAARKGDRIVDDDDLLMLGRSQRKA